MQEFPAWPSQSSGYDNVDPDRYKMPNSPDFTRRKWLTAGAAIALGAPLRTRAQPSAKLPRVGLLIAGARPRPGVDAWFEEGLSERGYAPGKNIVLEYRAAEGRLELLPKFAAELAALPVDVLVVGGPSPLRAAIDAAPHIPIVMIASSNDPVGEGLVTSLARPGGNLTGLTYATSPERFGKQLELLKQAAPSTRRVAVWWDLDLAMFRRSWQSPLDQAARQLGLQMLPPTQVLERAAVVESVAAMKRDGANAMLVAIGGPTWPYRDLVAAEALRNRLATIAAFKEFTRAGGLLSYGPDLPALSRRGAMFVDRILKGARPGDLPIELPSKYELAINLKTARELGLALPNELLLRADEVIR